LCSVHHRALADRFGHAAILSSRVFINHIPIAAIIGPIDAD